MAHVMSKFVMHGIQTMQDAISDLAKDRCITIINIPDVALCESIHLFNHLDLYLDVSDQVRRPDPISTKALHRIVARCMFDERYGNTVWRLDNPSSEWVPELMEFLFKSGTSTWKGTSKDGKPYLIIHKYAMRCGYGDQNEIDDLYNIVGEANYNRFQSCGYCSSCTCFDMRCRRCNVFVCRNCYKKDTFPDSCKYCNTKFCFCKDPVSSKGVLHKCGSCLCKHAAKCNIYENENERRYMLSCISYNRRYAKASSHSCCVCLAKRSELICPCLFGARYCSKECQKKDWWNHREFCSIHLCNRRDAMHITCDPEDNSSAVRIWFDTEKTLKMARGKFYEFFKNDLLWVRRYIRFRFKDKKD